MGYLAVWKVLEEITTSFRKRQLTISETIMSDLKAARTMIKIMNADSGNGETRQKIEEYLGTVEAHLMTEAEKRFTPEQITKWLKKLEKASCGELEAEMEESRFISGVPRDQQWLRVEPIASLPIEKLKQLTKENNLSTCTQSDGRLVVSGKVEDLKEFIKKLTKIANEKGSTA